MLIYDALVLARIAANAHSRKSILALGVPTLNFSDRDYRRAAAKVGLSVPQIPFHEHVGFFTALGYKRIDALDISAYEGATIVGDLNDPDLAASIGLTYDLVYDCGTLEHIFEATTALRTIARLTAFDGSVVHATPTNGFVDHGFWQVSPDLFRAFYHASGFNILTSAIFTLGAYSIAFPADKNIYREKGRGFIVANFPEAIAVFAAVKHRDSRPTQIGVQDYYSRLHGAHSTVHRMEFFIPYGVPWRAWLFTNPLMRLPILTIRTIRRIVRAVARKY